MKLAGLTGGISVLAFLAQNYLAAGKEVPAGLTGGFLSQNVH